MYILISGVAQNAWERAVCSDAVYGDLGFLSV